MKAVERATMGDRDPGGGVSTLLSAEHVEVLGKVATALLGDQAAVEVVLERVARIVATEPMPDGVKPEVWLLGLVRNACAVRASALPSRVAGSSVDEPSALGREVRARASDEAAPLARRALAALKPSERDAVVLSIVGRLEPADVAVACNVDVTTARARITRGLTALMRSELREGEGEP